MENPVARAMTQTLATGARNRGFTLIELLVVLVIAGITLGLVTLSFHSSQSRQLAEQGQHLAALMNLATDEARLTGQPVLLRVDRNGWQFVQEWGQTPNRGLTPNPPTATTIDPGSFSPPLDRLGLWPVTDSNGSVDKLEIWLGREALNDPMGILLQQGVQQITLTSDGLGGYKMQEQSP
jgi:general secretion pathway protein H